MDLFFKTAAGVMLALVLVLAVGKQERDLSMVLAVAVCCMTAGVALWFLEPVMDFLYSLELTGAMAGDTMTVLLKVVGLGLLTEMADMICRDSGQDSLGKALNFLGTAVILRLSIPVFEGLLDVIREIMGEL